MNKNLLVTVSAVFLAAGALVICLHAAPTAESLIGYGSVFAILCVVAVEYRVNWRGIFGR